MRSRSCPHVSAVPKLVGLGKILPLFFFTFGDGGFFFPLWRNGKRFLLADTFNENCFTRRSWRKLPLSYALLSAEGKPNPLRWSSTYCHEFKLPDLPPQTFRGHTRMRAQRWFHVAARQALNLAVSGLPSR